MRNKKELPVLILMAVSLFLAIPRYKCQTAAGQRLNSIGLGQDVTVQNDGNQVILFKEIKLEKGFDYAVIVTGVISAGLPVDLDDNCDPAGVFTRLYSCNIGTLGPLPAVANTDQPLAAYTCTSGTIAGYKKKCATGEQFQKEFIFPATSSNRYIQVYFTNAATTEITCKQKGGSAKTTIELPVIVKAETRVEVIKLD